MCFLGQLMYSQSLTVLDLRNTLPNLKSLILLLSYDPSHACVCSLSEEGAPADERSRSDFSNSTFAGSPLTVTSSPSLTLSSPSETSTSPSSSDALASTSDESSDSDDEPRTVKAQSVRSTSPASTLKGGESVNGDCANGDGAEKAVGSAVVQDEAGKAKGKGKMGSLRGAWRVGAVGL